MNNVIRNGLQIPTSPQISTRNNVSHIQCNTIQYNAMQRNATQRNAIQYNTIQYKLKKKHLEKEKAEKKVGSIGLYRENAIAIQKESGDSNGGNV